jgi:hypothetical protein
MTEENTLTFFTVTSVQADVKKEYLPNTSQMLMREANYFINSLVLVITSIFATNYIEGRVLKKL